MRFLCEEIVQLPKHTPYSGTPLVRVLARMMQTGVPASESSLPDRLSQWLGWTDAIALSSALDAAAPAAVAADGTVRGDATVATLEAALCARTRATLTEAIGAIGDSPRGALVRRGGVPVNGRGVAMPPRVDGRIGARVEARADADANAPTVDFALFRQLYQTQQQSMENAVGELRGRLRATLAARGGPHARLALVDATLARALDAREHGVLAAVPALLEAHFTRLRDAALAAAVASDATADSEAGSEADAEADLEPDPEPDTQPQLQPQAQPAAPRDPPRPAAPPDGAWLDAFCEDLRAVLLAELDVRFHPVEGLLAALGDR
jgi:hypothetical protein